MDADTLLICRFLSFFLFLNSQKDVTFLTEELAKTTRYNNQIIDVINDLYNKHEQRDKVPGDNARRLGHLETTVRKIEKCGIWWLVFGIC